MADGQEDRKTVGTVVHDCGDGRFMMSWVDSHQEGEPYPVVVGTPLVLTVKGGPPVHAIVTEIVYSNSGDLKGGLVRIQPLQFEGSVQVVVKPAVCHA